MRGKLGEQRHEKQPGPYSDLRAATINAVPAASELGEVDDDAGYFDELGVGDLDMLPRVSGLTRLVKLARLVLAWRNGGAVRLADVARVTDSVQDVRNYGVANGQPAILLQIYKQPGANILDAVERVRALLPQLQASIF